MVCFQEQKNNQYLCSEEHKISTSFMKITPTFINRHIPPPTYASNKEYNPQMTDIQLAFAFFSTYLLFPLLYIIISTGNITPITILWNLITSGIFNTVRAIKEFLTDVVYTTLRIFGLYTFSTYTIVKNGREIYSASSMCFYMKSDINSVYRIDRAKYNVCKWIDRQCKQYRINNSGDEPELTETHNDIYDFIIHKVDNQPFVRIHRGDFNGRTHTLIHRHYRPFKKWNQIANHAKLTVCLPPNTDNSDTDSMNTSETFKISLKYPNDYLLEKNEILDKKFLQWVMNNEYGRSDISHYIGQPFSKYTLILPYHDSMKQYITVVESKALDALNTATATATATATEQQCIIYNINDSHSILIGNKYIVKVDSVLRCPVFESNDSQVYDVDSMLTSYYSCSDSETETESDAESDAESDTETATATDSDAESATKTDNESKINDDNLVSNNNSKDENVADTEFEMIDEMAQ